jgi:5-methylcytosine-specific restriction enzyme A
MPTKLLGPCKTRTCPNIRTNTNPYCEKCSADGNSTDQYRGSSAHRGYGHIWRKLRIMVLRRHPICADSFGIGCVSVSRHADHIVPKRQGGQDMMENLQGLCDSCHSRKTLLEQSFTFTLQGDGPPTMFVSSGRIIQLFTAASAPPESKPIEAWPATMAASVWGRGWVKSLEPSPARPPMGHACIPAK